jgi:hypothetical protein
MIRLVGRRGDLGTALVTIAVRRYCNLVRRECFFISTRKGPSKITKTLRFLLGGKRREWRNFSLLSAVLKIVMDEKNIHQK